MHDLTNLALEALTFSYVLKAFGPKALPKPFFLSKNLSISLLIEKSTIATT
jgi:hypothetical protein